MAYTPGVARVCMDIAKDAERSHDYTIKKNTVAIVSDGTAVLGLGDIGPDAAMPVMEGKALLFKHFAGVDAFPICIEHQGPRRDRRDGAALAPTFGGINLEDIAAPGAFEVEERLVEALDIPVFHDDQHGTAIVTLAALDNALKIVGKHARRHQGRRRRRRRRRRGRVQDPDERRRRNVVGVDRQGAVHTGREGLNSSKQWFAENTNPEG
jgi:malate dehydrogenase (oxaloacetate-decarboxylating)